MLSPAAATPLGYASAMILGVVQGLTEFLPVSSSGHLALANHFGIGSSSTDAGPPVFDVLLHLATALVVIRAFWAEIKALAGSERQVLLYLIAGSLPVAIIGFSFEKQIGFLRESPVMVCGALLITGAFLFVCERTPTYTRKMADLGYKGAFIVGMAQALAIVPGISRSGLTITGGVICGMERPAAIKYSFLLMLPAVLGANLLKVIKHSDECTGLPFGPAALGFFAALISGHLALSLLQKLVVQRRLNGFAIYCTVIGLSGLAYFLTTSF